MRTLLLLGLALILAVFINQASCSSSSPSRKTGSSWPTLRKDPKYYFDHAKKKSMHSLDNLEDLPGGNCTDCRYCSNHARCIPVKCPSGCPSLKTESLKAGILIMKVNFTMRDYAYGYYGRVLRTYTGSNTELAVGVGPQDPNSPCFTTWVFDEPYIVALVYTGAKRAVCLDPRDGPTCFYIDLNQCHYFKLYSLLTPEEVAILNQYK
jgi:predicted Zn-ribbon and HTH transcriptional regulator